MWKRIGLILALLLLYANADAAVRTTLQNAATATANGTNMTVDEKGAAGITITGTFVGTISFEGSADGATTFSAVTCTEIASLTSSTTTTTTGQYQCPVAGLSHFRARISSYTSGSITAIGTASNGSLGSVGSGGPGGAMLFCWATAASPTYVEASANTGSCDLAGNFRFTLETMLFGEDSTNSLIRTSGGAVRPFTIMTGVTTNTTSATAIVHSGGKTPMASLTGTGALTGTVKFYGDFENTTTAGEWICTLVLDATTKGVGYCNQFTKDYPYYHAVTTLITGTSATVEAQIMVGAVGIKNHEFKPMVPVTADTLVQTGPGFLQCVMFSQADAAPTAGTVAILDSTTAGAGTVIFTHTFTTAVFAPIQICPQVTFTTGLFIDVTTSADISVAVSRR